MRAAAPPAGGYSGNPKMLTHFAVVIWEHGENHIVRTACLFVALIVGTLRC